MFRELLAETGACLRTLLNSNSPKKWSVLRRNTTGDFRESSLGVRQVRTEALPMAKVAAYHTTSDEESAHNREVYHDHDNCPTGKQIKSWNRAGGTAGRPRCKDCVRLD
jgi:hypothetical protein